MVADKIEQFPMTVSDEAVQKSFEAFLTTSFSKEEEANKFFKGFLKNDWTFKNGEIPYDIMTNFIFHSGIEYPEQTVSSNIDFLIQNWEKAKKFETMQDCQTIMQKVMNHTRLAFTQRDTFQSMVNEAQLTVSKLNENVDKIQKKTAKISVEFTTVLGLFTSIVFALFGGVQVVANLLNSNKPLTARDLGNNIVLASIATLLVFLLLISLLSGISKITEKHYDPFTKVTALILSLIITMMIGGLLYGHRSLSGHIFDFISHNQMWFAIPLLILAVILPFIVLFLTIHPQNKPLSKTERKE